jgi:hypothetical protein
MKTNKLFTSGSLAAAVLALACSAPRTQGTTIITNTFDFTFATGGATSPFNSTWIYWYNQNPGYTDILVDPKTDSSNPIPGANTSGSGSLKVISPLNETVNEQDVFFGTFASNINNAYDFSVEADTAFYTNVSFDILVAPGTPLSSSGNYGAIQVGFITTSYGQDWITAGTVTIPASASSSWYHVSVPIDQTQGFGNVPGIALDINSFSGYPKFTITNWIDNISINASTNPPQQSSTNSTNYIGIDAGANRNPISPMIYGVAFATSNQLEDLNFTMNRSGGNEESTYNWEINAHGKGADWYFESYPDSSATPGESADSIVADSKAAGAQALITIPMMSWGPKLGSGRAILPSYSISKYGPQTGNDPYFTDAGDGVGTNSATQTSWLILTNNPNDSYIPVDTNFQKSYVQHLITNWGVSTNGGVGYYIMDNEHSIWFSTHQDIHPIGPTMQEILGKIEAYASMVKSVDPQALVLGPEEWGWNGYFYSGYDQQWSASNNDYTVANYPDRKTNGGWDYMPWLLNQLHQYQTTNGQRLLDYFTLHCYPQETGVGGDDTDTATELLRNQSTRQFWDTNYVDSNSWINADIMLIPRMKNWVATYYPGTKIGVTEYNWGAEASMSGATAQADILGIFGREGLDLATRWEVPASPTYLAMKMYRNYDGNDSTFGDTSVLAAGPDPDNVAVFAAERSKDGALTIMIVNKYLTGNTPLVINLTNYTGSGSAQVWQLNSSEVITQLSNLPYSAGKLQTTVPAQSVTLLVIPPSSTLSLLAGSPLTGTNFQFWVKGEIGGTFVLQSSTNLSTWLPVSTNTLGGPQLRFLLPATGTRQFFRAVSTAL